MYSLFKKNSAFFVPYLLFLLGGITCLGLWGKINVTTFVNGHNSPPADIFFKYYTLVGLGYLIIPVLLALACVSLRYTIMSAAAFLLSFIVNDSIKIAVGAPRPLTVFNSLNLNLHHVPGVEIYLWNSFPSGHTAVAFGVFCLLALVASKKSLKLLFFIAAFLVGYSRIYLAEHFITDVIAASAIGVASAICAYKMVLNWRWLSKFAAIDKPLIRL